MRLSLKHKLIRRGRDIEEILRAYDPLFARGERLLLVFVAIAGLVMHSWTLPLGATVAACLRQFVKKKRNQARLS